MGQQLAVIILMHISMVALRIVAQTVSRKKEKVGGFLILDNPTGELNNPELLWSPIELVEQVGLQLVFFTGIMDLNTLAEFNNLIQLRHVASNDATGQKHLECKNGHNHSSITDLLAMPEAAKIDWEDE